MKALNEREVVAELRKVVKAKLDREMEDKRDEDSVGLSADDYAGGKEMDEQRDEGIAI